MSDQCTTGLRATCSDLEGRLQVLDLTGRRQMMEVGKEGFFRMDRLTGTNFRYHLLGDLMVDDDWTTTGESGTGVRLCTSTC